MNKKFYVLLLFVITVILSLNTLADSPRKGLIEEATSTACGPCAMLNPNFQEWVFNNLTILVPIVYHSSYSKRDPFYQDNPTLMNGRINEYYGIKGVPQALFNGSELNLKKPEETDLSKIVGKTSPLTISIEEKRNGNDDEVTITINSTKEITGKKLRIQVLEYYVKYNAINREREFYWNARKMLPDYKGIDFSIKANETKTFKQSFKLKSSWNKKYIYIAAFIQDDANKDVLQAEHNLKKVLTAPLSIDNKYLQIDGWAISKKEIKIKNLYDEPLKVKIDTTRSFIPAGWKVEINKKSITIPAKGTQVVNISISPHNKAGFANIKIFTEPISKKYYTHKKNIDINVLSKVTKYAVYIDNDFRAFFLIKSLSANSKFASKYAVVPLKKDILEHYPMENNFDLVMLSYDFFHKGLMTSKLASISKQTAKSLKAMVEKGKKIIITGEVELYNAFTPERKDDTEPKWKDFLSNTLGISVNGIPEWRISLKKENNIEIPIGIVKFNAKGIKNDPIGNGLDFTINDFSTIKTDPFVHATENIKSVAPKARPFLYFDNKKNKVGGVRIINGKSRAVYLSFSISAIKDGTVKNKLIGRILDWLFAKGTSGVDDNNSKLTDNRYLTFNISPNPVYDNATIKYTVLSKKVGNVQIYLSDVYGRVVKQMVSDNLTAGTYYCNLNVNDIASGSYLVVGVINGKTVTTPMIIAK